MKLATKRKSVKLTADEKRAFKKWLGEQETVEIAAIELGVARNTIDRVKVFGSGSADTISKVRSVIAS